MSTVKHNSISEKDGYDIKQEPAAEEGTGSSQETTSTDQTEKGLVISGAEKKLIRKLDKRILSIVCLTYLLGQLGRSSLGNARLQGLPEDTLHGDPTGVLFDWLVSAFYFSEILCHIPASVISKLFPPRLWLGAAAIGWGTCSTLTATGFNFPGLLVARLGLGVFQASFIVGAALYFALFYTKHELGLRRGLWFSVAALAGGVSGLIAFGVQHINAAVDNWRLLFIIEGIPVVLMGLVAMLLLPDRPEMTNFLNEDERKIAIDRMNRATSGDVGFVVNKAHIWAALKDWRIYMVGVISFDSSCAIASIYGFLPTIIHTFDFASQTAIAQVLTVPPYLIAAVVLMLTSYASDRAQQRGCFMATASTVAAVGYVILLMARNEGVRYFAVFLITTGAYTTTGLISAWIMHNTGSESKRAMGVPMYMTIGRCGSILGSHIYPSTEGPRYINGLAVSCALLFLCPVCILVLSFSYFMENRRRDRLYGKPKPDAKVDVSVLADKAPMFRYMT